MIQFRHCQQKLNAQFPAVSGYIREFEYGWKSKIEQCYEISNWYHGALSFFIKQLKNNKFLTCV